MRYVCHFSCGAASAVATKLALAEFGHESVVIVNAFIKEEHADNRRFLADCEAWFDHPVTVLQDRKFGASTHNVWRSARYIKGAMGAPCSRDLKRRVLDAFALAEDTHVLGYTADEDKRIQAFIDANNGIRARFLLEEKLLSKADCLAMVERAGIRLPEMYLLGFDNANCIGCPKGGAGYWNKIRKHFPEQFYQIADIQDAIGDGAKFLVNRRTGGRMSLRELPEDHGRAYPDEPSFSCSFFCEMAEQDIAQNAPAYGRAAGS